MVLSALLGITVGNILRYFLFPDNDLDNVIDVDAVDMVSNETCHPKTAVLDKLSSKPKILTLALELVMVTA